MPYSIFKLQKSSLCAIYSDSDCFSNCSYCFVWQLPTEYFEEFANASDNDGLTTVTVMWGTVVRWPRRAIPSRNFLKFNFVNLNFFKFCSFANLLFFNLVLLQTCSLSFSILHCHKLALYQFALRLYKITHLTLIHLFPKKWGGRRHFFFTHQDTRKIILSGARSSDLEHIFKIFGKGSLLRTRNNNKIRWGGL
jgi:hypothetical protein